MTEEQANDLLMILEQIKDHLGAIAGELESIRIQVP